LVVELEAVLVDHQPLVQVDQAVVEAHKVVHLHPVALQHQVKVMQVVLVD
jgi:hypothetical protein